MDGSMILIHAIKKAAVAVQIAIAPHELGSPIEGTEVAKVVPAMPSEDSESSSMKQEAAKIIRQVGRPDMNVISESDRRMVIEQLRRAGPPRDALAYNSEGKLCTLDGKLYAAPPRIDISTGKPMTPEESRKLDKRYEQTVPAHNSRLTRAQYLQYKASRLPD